MLPAIRDKIYRGEFVNFFSLLFRQLGGKDKEELKEKSKEDKGKEEHYP